MILVILAGGLGSRYGGEKQFESLGPNGEWLLEYNLYDALLEGCTEVVVIVHPDALSSITSKLRSRIPPSIPLTFVAQSLTDVPFDVPAGRTKPWGTAHAVWSARKVIRSPFVTVNADDLYGRAALRDAASMLKIIQGGTDQHALVTYELQKTISPNGGVSRGVCQQQNGMLEEVLEYTDISWESDVLKDKVTGITFPGTTQVSMNLWVLQPSIMKTIEATLKQSAESARSTDSEFYLPDVIQQSLKDQQIQVFCRPTASSWLGLTYREDRQQMTERLEELIARRVYPANLYPDIPEVIRVAYGITGDQVVLPISAGLINKTYKVTSESRDFILQMLNGEVFSSPEKLMHNIRLVNEALQGGDRYTVPELVLTASGDDYFKDDEGATWRAMEYISGTETHSSTSKLPIAEEAGRIIGRFHRRTATVPVDNLHLTLPNFHQVEGRFKLLRESVRCSPEERLEAAAKLTQLVRRHMKRMLALDLIDVPVRVTHNDTKLNNILFDRKDRRAVCLVDLDTLMPGKIHHDVADAVRTLCNSVSENEPDATKVKFNVPLFRSFCDGYFEEVGEILTSAERQILPQAMLLLPYLQGVRFLTDYLNGNVYYQTAYPDQNLDRANNQFALFHEVKHWQPVIEAIVEERS